MDALLLIMLMGRTFVELVEFVYFSFTWNNKTLMASLCICDKIKPHSCVEQWLAGECTMKCSQASH
jgi:hypothetical protein